MNGNRASSQRSGKGKGAAWAALVLSAGLAAVPAGAAWAGEASDAGSQSTSSPDGQAAIVSQQTGAQVGKTQAQAAQDGGQQSGAAQRDQQDSATQGASSSADQGAAAQQAPAASSDAGTYEQAGLHALTITYVDERGSQIAPAHREALADGESYSVQSPAVGGYELADASQATVSGSVAKGSGDVSVTVTYNSTLATYTVVHERQVNVGSDDYRVADTETFQAPSGTKVTAAVKTYENYDCVTSGEGLTTEVTPDGKAVIVVKYDVKVPSYGIYFSTGSTYVAPVTGKEGDAVTTPADPTRAGYDFAGWDIDGDGQADALPSTFPASDIYATALWTPATTTYLVDYWVEGQGADTSYHLLKTATLRGTTESETSAAPLLDTSEGTAYQWYKLAREDQAQTIKGDGTTVLNVYYDWKRVELSLKVQVGSKDVDIPGYTDPLRLKMGDTIALPDRSIVESAYRENGGKKANFSGWQIADSNTSKTTFTTTCGRYEYEYATWDDEGSLRLVYRALFTDSQTYPSYIIQTHENADGSTYSTQEPLASIDRSQSTSWYSRSQGDGYRIVAYRMSKNVWDGADQSAIEWDDWVSVPSDQTIGDYDVWLDSQDFTRSNVTEFKYDRIAYYVTYYSNGQVAASNRQIFGSMVDTSAAVDPEAPEGMEFAGWYTDSDFSGDPVISLTMPIGGTSLYAKWIHPAVYVTFDSAGGSAVDVQKVSWGDKATRPADPTRAGYKFGGWYYVGAGSDTPAPFSFDLGLEGDVNLIAAWSSTNTPTTYTVIHKAADGTVLYRETLSGTVGQTVTALELPQDDVHRQGLAYASASGKTIDLAASASQNVIEFTYSGDASHPYVVHLWDEETGLPIAADVEFDSVEALLNYAAPTLSGYHVLNGGQGYLSTRDDGQELTFWYEKDAEPAQPGDSGSPDQPGNQDGPDRPGSPAHAGGSADAGGGVASSDRAAVPSDEAAASAGGLGAPTTAASAPASAQDAAKAAPRTGDATSAAVPLGFGVVGAALAALSLRMRRRASRR